MAIAHAHRAMPAGPKGAVAGGGDDLDMFDGIGVDAEQAAEQILSRLTVNTWHP